MRATDARLAIPATVAWAAAFVAIAGAPVPVALALWLVAAGLLVAAFRWRWLATPALAVAAAALVTTVAVAQAPARHPPDLEYAAEHHQHVTLLVESTQTAVPGSRFVAGTAGSAPVLVFAQFDDRVEVGETLEVRGTLKSVPAGDDVSYLVFADDPPESRAPPPWWLAWSAEMRASFATSAAALPGDGGALLPGLAIGDTTAVDESLSSAMKASSLPRK